MSEPTLPAWDDKIRWARACARRWNKAVFVRLDVDELDAVLTLAVLESDGSARDIGRAVQREIRRVDRELGLFDGAEREVCAVPGCGRQEWPMRRGRCSRCARRAERGRWQQDHPDGDPARYQAYVAERPAARLARARLGHLDGASSAGRELVAMRRSVR